MSYRVKEIFATLQGEGFWTGVPSVFIRFSGCNLWSGRQEHRARDAARQGARCPEFCDTDFAVGTSATAAEIARAAARAAREARIEPVPHIVLTGGEPLLQVDAALVEALRSSLPGARIAVETNGTVVRPEVGLDWITVSPKTCAERLRIREGDELKVVFPSYDPEAYLAMVSGFSHLFVSPEARTTAVGASLIDSANMRQAVEWVKAHPRWRLSLQTHKFLQIP